MYLIFFRFRSQIGGKKKQYDICKSVIPLKLSQKVALSTMQYFKYLCKAFSPGIHGLRATNGHSSASLEQLNHTANTATNKQIQTKGNRQ